MGYVGPWRSYHCSGVEGHMSAAFWGACELGQSTRARGYNRSSNAASHSAFVTLSFQCWLMLLFCSPGVCSYFCFLTCLSVSWPVFSVCILLGFWVIMCVCVCDCVVVLLLAWGLCCSNYSGFFFLCLSFRSGWWLEDRLMELPLKSHLQMPCGLRLLPGS